MARMKTQTGEIRADFSVEGTSDPGADFAVVLESKYGNDRNPDYFQALDAILAGLSLAGCAITRIEVASKPAMEQGVHERTLPLKYPIVPTPGSDPAPLRQEISAAQSIVVKAPDKKTGNRHRRIRLFVSAGSSVDADIFIDGIIPATGPYRLSSGPASLPGSEEFLADREAEDDRHENEIRNRTVDGPVEKKELITSRRGQGVYRKNVLDREKSCRVFGVSDPFLLRASHIKPWKDSDDLEKIDGDNGLMLSPHVDLLFDRGYITFEKDGTLLVSPMLNPLVLELWRIPQDVNVGSFTDGQDSYLAYHRENIFKS